MVFCGINPGRSAAASGHHFKGVGNRFWKTIHLAGFTPRLLTPLEDRDILQYHCGMTAVVSRPTSCALDLDKQEFLEGANVLKEKIEKYAPQYVAFLGKAAYATISGNANLVWGRQPDTFGGAGVWILPNPSGLNRGFSLDNLVRAYRHLRQSVG